MHDSSPLIARLGLLPHPEGGWYRETWRAPPSAGSARGAGTSILYLLEPGQRSHWHRVDATELWLFQAGTPLTLLLADEAGAITRTRVGPALTNDAPEQPQVTVPPNRWQSAEAGAGWCLVACVVVPAFEFRGFEMAPQGWVPGQA